MDRIKLAPNKTLKIIYDTWTPSHLPWDLRTVIDLSLTYDDILTLETGIALGLGECILILVNEDEA